MSDAAWFSIVCAAFVVGLSLGEVLWRRKDPAMSDRTEMMSSENWHKLEAERDRLREENVRLLHHVGKRAEAEAERDRLQARNGRLRKAVNWLRGANHDMPDAEHYGAVEDCPAWECQRARDILAEDE
jgi:hypothetical protein